MVEAPVLKILIEPPSQDVLAQRLRGRGTEDEEKVQKRLAEARAEVELAKQSNVYNYSVVNHDVELAVREIVNIVNQESGDA